MKICKLILITLFTFISYYSSCQQITFNKLYFPDSLASGGGAILAKGNGYIMTAIENDSLNRLLFIELDSIGNQVKNIKFSHDTAGFHGGYGSFIHTHDNGYCFVGDIETSTKIQHCMIRFNSNLDTLWIKIYNHNSLWQCVTQVCETTDKGFVMVGETDISSTITNVLIIKTDSLGNKLWEKSLSTGGLSRGWQIRETPDKGLLICGFKSEIGAFILKTDSTGNYKWSIFPNPQQYNGGGAIAVTNEGDYLFAYGFGILTLPGGLDCLSRLNIIKFNSQGGIIWDKKYDTISIDLSCAKIEILSNDDFYVLSNYLVGDLALDNQYNALLIKFNVNGDSLWSRRYSYTSNNYSENILYDGVATNDGGFIATGYIASSPDYLFSRIWVVKTDSMGNAPGMQYLWINEINKVSSKGDIKAFPNPASNQTTIAFPQQKEEGELQIYNMLGQLVYEEKLAKASKQKEINIQNFKAGLYKVIVKEKGIIKGQVSLIKN